MSRFGGDADEQRAALLALGVAADRVYLDVGLTGMIRPRPALREALAVARGGDTLVVTALSRLARSVPDAHELLNGLAAGEVTLAIDENYYPPSLLLSTPEASPDRDAGAAGVGRQSVWLRSIATAASALIRYSSAVWIGTGFSCLTGC